MSNNTPSTEDSEAYLQAAQARFAALRQAYAEYHATVEQELMQAAREENPARIRACLRRAEQAIQYLNECVAELRQLRDGLRAFAEQQSAIP